MRIRTEFPYTTFVEDVRIPLPDGTRLYARIWRPYADEPVPALLEYLPYRLYDWTAPRDSQRHPWYAGHGYASVRVDVRGHGNSEGLPGDEYDATELADGVTVVEWLAARPWCTGRVGMFGISWGGFNSLQIAALAPDALKAVVTVCSTDDRYDNDVHYMGGSVLAVDMHAWAATLLAFVCRPPDPTAVGDRWKEMWLERLAAVDPFIHTWLSHQTRDAYWRHGSVCEDYSAIKAAVLTVGGWHDPYRDTVLRLIEHLDAPVRGLIGPWSHQYPDRGLPPGPAIGFLQETLRWWDHWLKDKPTGVMDDPLLRSWISESHPPATVYAELPGRWVAEDTWPSPAVTYTPYALPGGPVRVDSPQHTGVDAGRFFPFGNDADLPPDQREEDGRSVCFDSAPLDDRVEILGRPRVRLRLRCDAPRGQVVARVCDVAPDGSSTLITRGVLNLLARHGRDRAVEWIPGATEDITFDLNGIGHAFPHGHRIRLALSSAYWPWIWPHPQPENASGFIIDAAESALDLPVRALSPSAIPLRFEEAEQSAPLPVVFPGAAAPRPERVVTRDVAMNAWQLDVDPRYGGTRIYPDGLEFTEDAQETYRIESADPLSAATRSQWHVRLRRPDLGWDVRIETRSEIQADATHFITFNEVTCHSGAEPVFHQTWTRRIPRTAG
ncbi:CocE/NonD family hydrolase [Streptomyces sp. H10-C2]|uniref:CocE/NonD family hydrolase n=1 Tax=unclassified Streptomyces TaxID=2593676 RepID=UPI0024BBDF93|nr:MULTISPECIES: CocE/NonD family hydrolase [unclassified Streptomyces]MDJ0342006.1 CocE/NonD family hydrolase [Streptomyces sp. PH10-H1]MDJ0369979.1 CocE/NonD family hydrolase [Streptomyces sp. H10-C2]MDJ0370020.1 CocE/NonD family hydrolase [Streptomyces sp. H10-C2]